MLKGGDLDGSVKARLTTWLIKQRSLGVKTPEVSSNGPEDAGRGRLLSVPERAEMVLRFIGHSERDVGQGAGYPPSPQSDTFFRMLAWSESRTNAGNYREQTRELVFFLDYLEKQGWIAIWKGTPVTYHLTVDGYAHLDELERRHVDSSQAFVAMWYNAEMKDAWKSGIKPGIEDAGYTTFRVDQEEHLGKIDDRIIAEIRRSRFVVADFTHGENGVRGSVCYEAGFADGLDIPVVFTCRVGQEASLPFDTRQYNHILWETPEKLRERLSERISATIGDGPGGLPS